MTLHDLFTDRAFEEVAADAPPARAKIASQSSVGSTGEPKPLWPLGDAWQAVANKSARVFRGLTSAP